MVARNGGDLNIDKKVSSWIDFKDAFLEGSYLLAICHVNHKER